MSNSLFPVSPRRWSGYAGVDRNGDGVGETPYDVAGGGTDRYPFVDEDMEFIPEFGAIVFPIVGMAAIAVVLLRRKKT